MAALAWSIPGPSTAQLPGAPARLLPHADRPFEIVFGNDFLGRGGAIDDYRTQQLALTGPIGARWSVTVDHSILTLGTRSGGIAGRLDQVTGSVGFDLARGTLGSVSHRVGVGVGVRAYGDAGGERIQNGFHRLVGSQLYDLPYTATRRTRPMAWLEAAASRTLREASPPDSAGSPWALRVWGRAGSLVTGYGEWDGSARLALGLQRRWFEVWVALQGDVRGGYRNDPVLEGMAAFERGAGALAGIRLGPLILETLQHFDGETAFGRLVLTADGRLPVPNGPGDLFGLQAGLSMPDVLLRLQGRVGLCRWLGCGSGARLFGVVDYRGGSPQIGDDATTYADTRQVAGGVELAWTGGAAPPRLTPFAGARVGWRVRKAVLLPTSAPFVQTPPLAESASVGRVGMEADLGVRVGAANGPGRTSLLLELRGLMWLPSSGADVTVEGRSVPLHRPSLGIEVGLIASLGGR